MVKKTTKVTSKEIKKKAADELDFEALTERLEKVTNTLEGGELSLDASMRLFEEGLSLARNATQHLDDAEQRIEVLLSNGQTQPLSID